MIIAKLLKTPFKYPGRTCNNYELRTRSLSNVSVKYEQSYFYRTGEKSPYPHAKAHKIRQLNFYTSSFYNGVTTCIGRGHNSTNFSDTHMVH